MTYLLDVNGLLAWLVVEHEHHTRVMAWKSTVAVAFCPITQLGFLRVAQSAYQIRRTHAIRAWKDWLATNRPEFVPCDLLATETEIADSPRQLTDVYLANLAGRHGMRLATLDEGIQHPAAFLIPS